MQKWQSFNMIESIEVFKTSRQTVIEFISLTIVPYLIYQQHYKYCSQRSLSQEDAH